MGWNREAGPPISKKYRTPRRDGGKIRGKFCPQAGSRSDRDGSDRDFAFARCAPDDANHAAAHGFVVPLGLAMAAFLGSGWRAIGFWRHQIALRFLRGALVSDPPKTRLVARRAASTRRHL